MPAPIDYTSQVASPFESAVQGLKLGTGLAGMRESRESKQLALEAQQRQSAIISDLINDPNPTAAKYARATLAAPQLKDQLKQSWEMQTEEKKRASIAEIGSVYSALANDKPQVAMDILNQRADALENTDGDPQQIQAARTMAKMIDLNPAVARTQTGFQLASIPGGEDIIESASKLAETRRKEGLYPSEIKQAAADIGKTEAQTKKILAETDKLGTESQKAILELERMKEGVADPEKQFDQEEKLRKEYAKRTGAFTESRRTYDNLKSSAAAGAAGDIALITSFMKMLDPGSVVRETEFATARDTTGLLTRLQNMATKIESGEFLSEPQRRSFVNLASKYMAATEKEEGRVREDLGKVVENYNLNPENVFGTMADGAVAPAAAPKNVTVDY